jgi:hypothetical protein
MRTGGGGARHMTKLTLVFRNFGNASKIGRNGVVVLA